MLSIVCHQRSSNTSIGQAVITPIFTCYKELSTDKTVSIIKKLNSSKIEVIEGKERMGVGEGTNILMAKSNSDIFVLLNADILIVDKDFIQKLIQPIVLEGADLVSGNLQPLPPFNYFEKILFASMSYKRSVFESYKKGQNLFTCYGPVRAFSKKLYKKIIFKKSVADDMYSYFFCIYHGFKYSYSKNAVAFFKLPNNLADYRKQSTRYWASAHLYTEFGEKFIKNHYLLPKRIFITNGFRTFLKHPLYASIYPFLSLGTRVESILKSQKAQNTWTIAGSSKIVRGQI
jgi:glycosyltransferase involved in cell wall biosynthesis